MAFTEGTTTRETASLIGSDKVEGTPVYRPNGERVGQIKRVKAQCSAPPCWTVRSSPQFARNKR
jgi:hypothetical protein